MYMYKYREIYNILQNILGLFYEYTYFCMRILYEIIDKT